MRFVRLAGAWLACMLFMVSASVVADDAESYRLTDAGLDRYERATEAMYRYAREHPEAIAALESEEGETEDEGFDARRMAAHFDAHAPGLREAMEASGMPLEEYFTFSVTLAASALGAAFAEQYGNPASGDMTPLQRDNLAFARKNMQRFQAFGEKMKKQYGDMESGDDESGTEY